MSWSISKTCNNVNNLFDAFLVNLMNFQVDFWKTYYLAFGKLVFCNFACRCVSLTNIQKFRNILNLISINIYFLNGRPHVWSIDIKNPCEHLAFKWIIEIIVTKLRGRRINMFRLTIHSNNFYCVICCDKFLVFRLTT